MGKVVCASLKLLVFYEFVSCRVGAGGGTLLDTIFAATAVVPTA